MTADPSRPPLMHIDGNVIRHIEPADVVPGDSPARRHTLEDVLTSSHVAYADERTRSVLAAENGLPVADPPHRALRVVVREATIPNLGGATFPESLPDIVTFRGEQLLRLVRVIGNDGGGGGGGSGGHDGPRPVPVTPSSTTSSPAPGSSIPPIPSIPDVPLQAWGGRILLVCLDDGRDNICEG